MRSRAVAVLATLMLLATLCAPAARAAVPSLDHVTVVIMENHSYDQVRTQPYTAGLIAASSTCTNSFAITHPSQPNYIAMWAGSTLGTTNDVCPAPGSPFTAENLGHACEAKGITWRAYSENLPAAGSAACTASGTLYTRKHDPWTQFSNLTHLNERPYGDLAADLAAHTLPRLAFVIPNNCNNTHDCPVGTGDAWLAANLPAMISGAGSNGVVILTWDEDNNLSGNHILTVFAGATVKTGFTSPGTVNHYNVLRTICDALGLTPFAGAATAVPILDVWGGTTAAKALSWGTLKLHYR